VDVGTANAANAMHNLYRSRLPVLLMAGKAPYTSHNELIGTRDTHVHFVQEPFDQGSLVRPYVKWEWTLPSGVVVKEALQRAYSIMQSGPCGPVHLMMQRETLTEHWSVDDIRRFPSDRFGALAGAGADPDLIAALADRILTAENPILITGYGGLIIFNEAVTNTPAVLMQIPRRGPNTAFNTNGAGLGWSGPMALGAKLAAPG